MRQLTSLDAQFLALENSRTHGHVGSLAVYDPSTAAGGAISAGDAVTATGASTAGSNAPSSRGVGCSGERSAAAAFILTKLGFEACALAGGLSAMVRHRSKA